MAEWSKALDYDAGTGGESPVRAPARAATHCPYAEWRACLWQGPHKGQIASVGGEDRVQSTGHVKLSVQKSAIALELRDRVMGSGPAQQVLLVRVLIPQLRLIKHLD